MFNQEYKDIVDKEVEASFWRELKVNYDKIQDEIANNTSEIEDILNKLPTQDLYDICMLLDLNVKNDMKHNDLKENIKQYKDNVLLLYLFQMIRRKKQYIDEYYNHLCYSKTPNYVDASSLVKLLHMYQINHIHLVELTVLAEWRLKATGVEYYIKEMKKNKIAEDMLVETKQEELCIYLRDNSKNKNEYKVAMYCKNCSTQDIFLMYKMKNDTQFISFDETKRIKSIEPILLMIDSKMQILHIKNSTHQETENIKKYMELQYGYELEKCNQEVSEDYDVLKFKRAFKTLDVLNQEGLENFYISRIAFNRCLLNKTPELIIGEGKKDIWPAVINANAMRVIDINSLDSVKTINICMENTKRVVRVTKMEDESIVFKLDDKALGQWNIDKINKKFTTMFGIPLNRRLKNKLEVGIGDEIDIILRTDEEAKIAAQSKSLFDDLVKDKIVVLEIFKKSYCENDECNFESEVSTENIEQCPFCESNEIKYVDTNRIRVNRTQIKKFLLGQIAQILKLEKDAFTETKEARVGSEPMMYRFLYEQKEYKVVIIDKVLSRNKIKVLEKQLVPTIIIYCGIDKHLAELMTPESISFLQFGVLYANKDNKENQHNIISRTIKELDDSINYHIVSAAKTANQSIKEALEGKVKLDKRVYRPNDFEDDVYAILKHLIFTSDKWGATETGKALPEGVLAFEYTKEKTGYVEKRAFSYDCKINYDGEGYSLDSSEKRKAMEYVNHINAVREIRLYCSDKELSSHLFIGNKFRANQLEQLKEYFEQNIQNKCSTKAVFIDIQGLVKMYDWFRKNYEDIQKNRNIFYELLHDVLIINNEQIQDKHWNNLIEEMEACFRHSVSIDTSRIKTALLK